MLNVIRVCAFVRVCVRACVCACVRVYVEVGASGSAMDVELYVREEGATYRHNTAIRRRHRSSSRQPADRHPPFWMLNVSLVSREEALLQLPPQLYTEILYVVCQSKQLWLLALLTHATVCGISLIDQSSLGDFCAI